MNRRALKCCFYTVLHLLYAYVSASCTINEWMDETDSYFLNKLQQGSYKTHWVKWNSLSLQRTGRQHPEQLRIFTNIKARNHEYPFHARMVSLFEVDSGYSSVNGKLSAQKVWYGVYPHSRICHLCIQTIGFLDNIFHRLYTEVVIDVKALRPAVWPKF